MNDEIRPPNAEASGRTLGNNREKIIGANLGGP